MTAVRRRYVVALCTVLTACSAEPSRVNDDAGASDDLATDDGTLDSDDSPVIDVTVSDNTDVPPPDSSASCDTAHTCSACGQIAGCGWCSGTSQCLAGTETSSADGTCVGTAWDFTGDDCVAPVDAGSADTGHACLPAGGENTNALCGNGIDDDCDGYTDCVDFNCSRNASVTVCGDGGVADAGRDAGVRDAGGADAGTIGPNGGTVDLFRFAAFGDVRPPQDNDTSSYPTTIVDSVMSGMAELGAQFAVASGDYMFANTTSQVSAQLDLFLAAEQRFGGTVFHAMGNHECTGGTASNCPNGNETPNVSAYLARLAAPHTKPYFDWTIHTSLGDAHFIAAAPNAWTTAQNTWLRTALAQTSAYTFVLAHEPPTSTSGPGSSAIDALIAARATPVTMILYGHTHEYRHIAANAVIDGNAGAPLAGTGSGDYYGFAMIEQRADGNVVFTAYQIGSPPMVVESFVVSPDGQPTR